MELSGVYVEVEYRRREGGERGGSPTGWGEARRSGFKMFASNQQSTEPSVRSLLYGDNRGMLFRSRLASGRLSLAALRDSLCRQSFLGLVLVLPRFALLRITLGTAETGKDGVDSFNSILPGIRAKGGWLGSQKLDDRVLGLLSTLLIPRNELHHVCNCLYYIHGGSPSLVDGLSIGIRRLHLRSACRLHLRSVGVMTYGRKDG
eukprot:scaffold741_cov41-Attheya_sp.AAC.4